MKVVVEDANVLLDLLNGGLLGLWLGLDFENCTTALVWHEVTNASQRQMVQPFIDSGLLTIRDVEPEAWSAISTFSTETGVSMSDGSVWLLAKAEGAVLLTGDSKLRKSAKATGVEVRGVLWVLDELVAREKIAASEAADSLKKMVEDGAFLPLEECRSRINKWGRI